MTRLEQARAEIDRRRKLAESATHGGWVATSDPLGEHVEDGSGRGRLAMGLGEDVPSDHCCFGRGKADAQHIAANNPEHVLAVLVAADAAFDRHSPRPAPPWVGMCTTCIEVGPGDPDPVPMPWPCTEARSLLDLYAPPTP
jgi:hypothetical protein